jgi:SAM-dependent methyltransferase
MDDRKQRMLDVLRSNKGFSEPERWLNYAIRHGLKRVRAEQLHQCPDCGCKTSRTVGQYVYYSTLVHLHECQACGLLYADKRIDPSLVRAHFERGYKDETYFQRSRRRVFGQVAALADSAAPPGGTVLDIGGAKGHLLAALEARRPDLLFVLNDLSQEACNHAARVYGFRTVCGDASDLPASATKFDVLIMSDVIYYEPDLGKFWSGLVRLLSDKGTVIVRVPNNYHPVRLWQYIAGKLSLHTRTEMQDRIPFFNPEHLYVFSRRYLISRLTELGFAPVTAMPSELLAKRGCGLCAQVYFRLCDLLFAASGGRLILTPSLLLVAKKRAQAALHLGD